MSAATIRKHLVALLLTGSAILLFACGDPSGDPDRAAEAAMMTEYSENLSIVMSQNGQRSYLFETPLLEGYTLGAEPYREFRRGIRMTTYQDDSLATVDAVLTANYAIYYENRQLWEAKGDVVVKKYDGTEVYTQQLFWNARTKKVYSNVDTKLVKGNNVTVGERFESDDAFKDWRFRYQKSRMEVDVTPSERDTTVTESPAVPVVTEGDRNARRHPETPPIRPRSESTQRSRPSLSPSAAPAAPAAAPAAGTRRETVRRVEQPQTGRAVVTEEQDDAEMVLDGPVEAAAPRRTNGADANRSARRNSAAPRRAQSAND